MPYEVTNYGKTRKIVLQREIQTGTQNYDVALEPGLWSLALAIDSAVTGAATPVITARLLTNSNPIQLNDADQRFIEGDAGNGVVNIQLTTNDEGRYGVIIVSPGGVPSHLPFPISHGIRISITQANATAGEKCILTLIATKTG